MRRNDVASTSFRCRVPIRFLINQCQITVFILDVPIIENSRIELRGIVLPVQMGKLLGGGPKGMLAPPLKLLGGAWPPPPPLAPPSSYAYALWLYFTVYDDYETSHTRQWTSWYNTDTPKYGGGDDESINSIRKVAFLNFSICKFSSSLCTYHTFVNFFLFFFFSYSVTFNI